MNFDTIACEELDAVVGGRAAQAAKAAGGWLWRNVAAPVAGGAIYNWAADRLGGGQQQPAQPAAQPPAQP